MRKDPYIFPQANCCTSKLWVTSCYSTGFVAPNIVIGYHARHAQYMMLSQSSL